MDNQNNQNPYEQPQQPMQPSSPAPTVPVAGPSFVQPQQPPAVAQAPAYGQPISPPVYREAMPQADPAAIPNTNRRVFRTYYLVYYVAGLLDVLLAFRFLFLLIGASTTSGFVSLIYSLTSVFVVPFNGIIPVATTHTGTVTSTFDAGIIFAVIVYSLVGWGLARLLHAVTAGRTPSA